VVGGVADEGLRVDVELDYHRIDPHGAVQTAMMKQVIAKQVSTRDRTAPMMSLVSI
jgi:hypothetical protein